MNKVDERLVTVSVSLPAAVVKLLDELAAASEQRSRSFIMRKFIENALSADERKAG